MSRRPKNKDKLKPKNNGSANRRKGHHWERQLAREFRDLGYVNCTTSRHSSRLLDDCKVDLNIPDFNIQAKNVRANINYQIEFERIEEALAERFPERLEFITAILHKKQGNSFAILKKEDFYRMLRVYRETLNNVN